MYAAGLILFLLLFLALYLTMTHEARQYDQLEEAMEEEKTKETEERNLIWEGRVDGYKVLIKRGMMFRDSNRLITVLVDLHCPFNLRLEPANPLRRLVRETSEFFGDNQKIKQHGPLEDFLLYSNAPDEVSGLITTLNRPEQVKTLRKFHHVVFSEERLTAWFYQVDIDIDEIKEKTEEFVELLKKIEIEQWATENKSEG